MPLHSKTELISVAFGMERARFFNHANKQGADDRTYRIWDIRTSDHLNALPFHPEFACLYSMHISPLGTMFAVCDDHGTVEVYDLLEDGDMQSRYIFYVRNDRLEVEERY